MDTKKKLGRVLALTAGVLFSGVVLGGPVNINAADAETLAKELEGVGETKAAKIVRFRTENGPFRSADDLVLVDGIGKVTVSKNRDNIIVEADEEASDRS